MRFLLQTAMRRALGYTEADDRAEADAPEGERIDPSEEGDGYAILCVYAAAIALCLPHDLPGVPPLRKLRHDAVAYGEHARDHFIRERISTEDIANQGRQLLMAMVKDAGSILADEVEAEMGFTGAQGAVSTSG